MNALLAAVLGVYVIIDSLAIGLWSGQRWAYAMLFFATALILGCTRRTAQTSRTLANASMFCWAICTTGFVMILSQDTAHTVYLVGDAATIVYTLMLIEIAKRNRTAFSDLTSIGLLAAFMFVASVFATVFSPLHTDDTARFFSPPPLLMVLGWLGMLRPSNLAIFYSSSIVSIVVLLLTLLSGARFAVLLWAGIGAALLATGHASRRVVTCLVVMLLVGLVVAEAFVIGLNPDVAFSDSRLGRFIDQLDDGQLFWQILEDASMQNRVHESSDALYSQFHYHGLLTWIFGVGHGATFEGATAYYGDRLLDNGESHHIHFGLVLLYFRYGIPGVAAYVWLICQIGRQLLHLRRCDTASPAYRASLTFTIAAGAYLINLLMCNELINPIFSLSVAGFLATREFPVEPAALMPRQRRAMCFVHTTRVLGR